MTFASTSFLFAFLPIVLFAYYGMPIRLRNLFLLLIAGLFYALAEPNYIYVLLLTVVLNYCSGIVIEKACISELKYKFTVLLLPIIMNLIILVNFKEILLLFFGIDQTPITAVPPFIITTTEIFIPIGISYYILQCISYLIDVYQNRIIAETNFINFALYVTMFPKIIAGPITKYNDMKKNLENRIVYMEDVYIGVQYFIFGLFKKVILSNNIAFLWASVYTLEFNTIPVATAWLGAIAFSFTLYFDMSGYTDMAIGIGKMFGFDLPNNFNYPYMAGSVTDFFRRFHITLMSWFDDYITQPIIKNKLFAKEEATTTHNIAKLVTWILIGVWYGVTAGTVSSKGGINFGANFIIFGFYFGLFVYIEEVLRGKIKFKIHKFIKHIYTVVVVIFGFVLLDPSDIMKSNKLILSLLKLNNNPLVSTHTFHLFWSNIVILVLCVLCSTNLFKKIDEKCNANHHKIYSVVKYVVTFVLFFTSLCYLL